MTCQLQISSCDQSVSGVHENMDPMLPVDMMDGRENAQ